MEQIKFYLQCSAKLDMLNDYIRWKRLIYDDQYCHQTDYIKHPEHLIRLQEIEKAMGMDRDKLLTVLPLFVFQTWDIIIPETHSLYETYQDELDQGSWANPIYTVYSYFIDILWENPIDDLSQYVSEEVKRINYKDSYRKLNWLQDFMAYEEEK